MRIILIRLTANQYHDRHRCCNLPAADKVAVVPGDRTQSYGRRGIIARWDGPFTGSAMGLRCTCASSTPSPSCTGKAGIIPAFDVAFIAFIGEPSPTDGLCHLSHSTPTEQASLAHLRWPYLPAVLDRCMWAMEPQRLYLQALQIAFGYLQWWLNRADHLLYCGLLLVVIQNRGKKFPCSRQLLPGYHSSEPNHACPPSV